MSGIFSIPSGVGFKGNRVYCEEIRVFKAGFIA